MINKIGLIGGGYSGRNGRTLNSMEKISDTVHAIKNVNDRKRMIEIINTLDKKKDRTLRKEVELDGEAVRRIPVQRLPELLPRGALDA